MTLTAEIVIAKVHTVLGPKMQVVSTTDASTLTPTLMIAQGKEQAVEVGLAATRAQASKFPMVVLLAVRTHTNLWQSVIFPDAVILFLPTKMAHASESFALACFNLSTQHVMDLQSLLGGHVMVPSRQYAIPFKLEEESA